MSKTVIQTADNFTIRKINALEIVRDYFKGIYKNRGLPDKKVKTGGDTVRLGKAIGKDSNSEIFRFVDHSNNHQTILTTNHSLYQYAVAKQSGVISELPIIVCKYCKRKNLKAPIGLPVSMEIEEEKVTFTVVDSFCDFGCAFSFLKRQLSLAREYRGPLYMNSEQMLYSMYYRMYPDKTGDRIREKPDWDLLRENGGPLTDEEFDGISDQYVPVTSVITVPGKKQYLKVKS